MMARISLVTLFLIFVAPSAAMAAPGVWLADLRWPQAEQRLKDAPLVIVPFAAGAKEHGPHLPMNADAVVLEYLLERAIETHPVVVVPPVLHGWMPAFRDFPGTGIAAPDVFQDYMWQLSESLLRHGARRLVYLNTGITRASGLPISIVAREIRVRHGVPTLVLSWDDLETDEVAALSEQREGGHADEIETSINLFLQPDNVRMDLAVTDYGRRSGPRPAGYEPGLFSRDPSDPAYSESGLYGDPTLATAEKGRAALAIMTQQWLAALAAFAGEANAAH